MLTSFLDSPLIILNICTLLKLLMKLQSKLTEYRIYFAVILSCRGFIYWFRAEVLIKTSTPGIRWNQMVLLKKQKRSYFSLLIYPFHGRNLLNFSHIRKFDGFNVFCLVLVISGREVNKLLSVSDARTVLSDGRLFHVLRPDGGQSKAACIVNIWGRMPPIECKTNRRASLDLCVYTNTR